MTDEQPSDYAQARAEAAGLLGLDLERLSAADALKIDLCIVLRRAIDTATEDMFAGGAVDLAKLQGAVERLIGLLPAGELSQSPRPGPRQQMWQTYLAMRERGEQFAKRAAEPTVITPTEADVVPPGELGEFFRGPPRPGPDDPPRQPVTIEGKAAPAASAAPSLNAPVVPLSGDETKRRMDRVNSQPIPAFDTRPANEPWRSFVGGDPTDRWSNRNGA
jgi:hypothetical protein